MLACARIGAVHSVVFGGFSSDALASRIHNAGAKYVITATGGLRGKKTVPLKQIVDKGLEGAARLGSQVCSPWSCSRLKTRFEDGAGNGQ